MLEKLKILLGIKDEEKDPVLLFCIETASNAVKNYCNIEKIPKELETTVIRMAMSCYKSGTWTEAENSGKPQTVASVKRGDVTVSYQNGGSGNLTGGSSFLGLLEDYKAQLQPFRKVRWNL